MAFKRKALFIFRLLRTKSEKTGRFAGLFL